MRRMLAATCAALAATALAVSAARAAKADFSGTWVLDAAKSEGVPPNAKQTMKVTQTGDKIDVELKVTLPNGQERTITDSYTADAKPVDFKPQPVQGAKPDSTKNGKRVARWAAGGSGVEIVDTWEAEFPEGVDVLQAKRTWSLSADGKTLTIYQDVKMPLGSSQGRRVFTKQ